VSGHAQEKCLYHQIADSSVQSYGFLQQCMTSFFNEEVLQRVDEKKQSLFAKNNQKMTSKVDWTCSSS